MDETSGRALVLVARPTPSGVDGRSLARLAATVAARVPGPVRVAHLDQEDPSVPAVLDALASAGTPAVLLVPLAVPADRYLTTWIGRAVAHWRASTPDPGEAGPDVRIAPDLTALAADAVVELAEAEGVRITASASGFASPAWSVLDVPDRHLFVCRGPRCLVHGAGATHRALAEAVKGTSTQVTPCGCLGPCNLGPLVVEHPEGTWHTDVDPLRARDLASQRR
ncbi:(2Fe-2S) ferredoxin domain-containing protein [Pseudonocardia sp. NPDC049635]|uniref:(2Fe-2S) ferredoxin domain-containing protein n=1 Tax=Pseudonocardia sp. NPDC049635 TaxID=3155506 RepID=UPI00340DE5EE